MKRTFSSDFLLICIVFFLISCKKDCESAAPTILLPAIQKVREAANKNWQPEKGYLQKMEIKYSSPLKPEYAGFLTDTTIHTSCFLKLKGQANPVRLPYTYTTADGGTNTFFVTELSDKMILYFYNSSGTSAPVPTESMSLNFTKINF
jgi:hypothetical protein